MSPGPENSVTGNDERHAEIEALTDVFLSHADFRGDRAFATLLAERCMRRLDRVRRAPGPSSRERDTGTEAARIRAEAIAEIVEWLKVEANRPAIRAAKQDHLVRSLGLAIEREFAGPRARNDEHETENKG